MEFAILFFKNGEVSNVFFAHSFRTREHSNNVWKSDGKKWLVLHCITLNFYLFLTMYVVHWVIKENQWKLVKLKTVQFNTKLELYSSVQSKSGKLKTDQFDFYNTKPINWLIESFDSIHVKQLLFDLILLNWKNSSIRFLWSFDFKPNFAHSCASVCIGPW
jgi:hypothetical protein